MGEKAKHFLRYLRLVRAKIWFVKKQLLQVLCSTGKFLYCISLYYMSVVLKMAKGTTLPETFFTFDDITISLKYFCILLVS